MPEKTEQPKKSTIAQLKSVWPQIWALVKPRRLLLATSFVLLIINRVTGLALPFSSRILIDRVIPGKDLHLLWLLVAGITLATVIQAVTSYVLMQTLSKEGQRAIAELRRKNIDARIRQQARQRGAQLGEERGLIGRRRKRSQQRRGAAGFVGGVGGRVGCHDPPLV